MNDTTHYGSARITFTVGALIRRQVQRAMLVYAWTHNYALDVDEDKGLLDSVIHFRFSKIPASEMARVKRDIDAYARRLSED